VFCPYDGRKNWEDLVTAFCMAFAHRPDATLVLKLVHHNNALAGAMIANLLNKLPPHKCQIIAIDRFLNEHEYEALMAATTFVVNCSFAEGQCLPLMEFMSFGKPAVAPQNTAMVDYIDAQVAFIVRSSPELCCWPHDPRWVFRARRYRIDWQSLVDAYHASYAVAKYDPQRYEQMSRDAIERLRGHCSEGLVHAGLQQFVEDASASQAAKDRAKLLTGLSIQERSGAARCLDLVDEARQ
jgi:glycosyltransferase involved in cell wall biosynthesis